MLALLATLALCWPVTVDAVTGSTARLELGRCGLVTVPAAPWMREGWTSDPRQLDRVRELRERLPVGPAGHLDL